MAVAIIYAAEQGAIQVTGTDISQKMLSVARQKTLSPVVKYQLIAMEDLAYEAGSFDVVISSLAFHYTPDFEGICSKVYRFLTPEDSFVFSVEHSVFTAYGSQDWIYDHQGNKTHWPVDNYFAQEERRLYSLGKKSPNTIKP